MLSFCAKGISQLHYIELRSRLALVKRKRMIVLIGAIATPKACESRTLNVPVTIQLLLRLITSQLGIELTNATGDRILIRIPSYTDWNATHINCLPWYHLQDYYCFRISEH